MSEDTVDYKHSLNLPETGFPMKANLAQREPEILARWDQQDIYHKILQRRDPSKSFILADGPPYANGDIHIGHALNKILKDIVVKSKAFSGYYAPYIPGWDCHGLPIEIHVEKKEGKPGVKIDAAQFRKKCREYATQQVDIQRNSFKRLGVFGDWNNPYKTMDFSYEADVIRTLAKIIERGHLTRGDRPVYWCVHCGSALAEAEVEYQDKTSDAVDVLFKVIDRQKAATIFGFKTDKTISAVIWTTTPWTLPANQAVAVNPNLQYQLVAYDDQYLIIAEQLLPAVRERIENLGAVVASCTGKDLELLQLQHPFYDRTVPIILGDHVTTDAGTGCVHTAPAHGIDDYTVGKHYNLPIDNPVDANGCFYKNVPLFGGQFVFKANAEIIRVLREQGRLLSDHKVNHSYPHCWRHKEPLIFRATPQWFISMEQKGLRNAALAEIKKVQWIPEWGEARIAGMIDGRPDWCISRQRAWGMPMALFIDKQSGALHPRTAELMEQVAKLIEQKGIEAWFALDIADILPANEAAQYEKVPDTLDVWFDSGAAHYCVADQRPEMHSPVDMYLEGSDQHRGWFQSSLLSSVAAKGAAPYKEVLTHGFTVDASGKKMSKSLGNVIAPEQVMRTLGADILRLWVAATDYRSELHVSDEILKRTSDAYRRIRNTARFLLANLHGFDPTRDMVSVDQMLMLDRWIVDQAHKLQETVLSAYNSYDFLIIYQEVHNFCSFALGSFYLDVIKDRQYTCKSDGVPRRSAQTAMYHLLEALVRWIAPILSFTAEEIWQYMPGKRDESVFLQTWYADLPTLPADTKMNDQFWQQVLLVRDEVNKVLEENRKNAIIGSGLEAEVTLYCGAQLLDVLSLLNTELRFVLITSKAEVVPLDQAPKSAVATEIKDLLIEVKKSLDPKCQRCWHRRSDVNMNAQYPNICQRCVANITEVGEQRAFA